jgi:hypothetical protein
MKTLAGWQSSRHEPGVKPVQETFVLVLFGQENRRGRTVRFCDDPELDAALIAVDREQTAIAFERFVVCLPVVLVNISPVSLSVATETHTNVTSNQRLCRARRHHDFSHVEFRRNEHEFHGAILPEEAGRIASDRRVSHPLLIGFV